MQAFLDYLRGARPWSPRPTRMVRTGDHLFLDVAGSGSSRGCWIEAQPWPGHDSGLRREMAAYLSNQGLEVDEAEGASAMNHLMANTRYNLVG